MCGRINVSDHEGLRALLAMMGMNVWPITPPRFNVAPTSNLDVITLTDDGHALGLESMLWGFSGNGNNKTSRLMFNARSETVFNKPSFRSSALSRRAIVPINGFYEWQAASARPKRAFHVAGADTPAIMLAAIFRPHVQPPDQPAKTDVPKAQKHAQQLSLGLCLDDNETNSDSLPEKDAMQSSGKITTERRYTPENDVCVLTMQANEKMAPVHHRMPLILNPEQAQRWLHDGDEILLETCYQRADHINLLIEQVDGFVNKVSNDGPACLTTTTLVSKSSD